MLEKKLISNFRDFVIDKSDYFIHNYKNQKGKNRWNIICSAMDWITVGVENINTIEFKSNNTSELYKDILLLISMTDVILESVTQLSRVIPDATNHIVTSNNIFSRNDFCDDLKHFKHTRAVFGAHPVNLNPSQNKDDRWYAAWPYQGYDYNYDLQAYLYPLDTDEEMKIFGVNIEEIENYSKLIYGNLVKLQECISLEFENYIKRLNKVTIEYSGNVLEDINLASDKVKQRLPNTYIESRLNEIKLYFNTISTLDVNKDVVNFFLRQVEVAFENIKESIQKLDYSDVEDDKIFSPTVPQEYQYEFNEYFSVLEGEYVLHEHQYFETISNVLGDYVSIRNEMTYNEKKLLINAGLCAMNCKEDVR